jgi:hypothetical protein
MNQKIGTWQMAGFLFTSVVGTFLHFLFELTGENMIAGVFSAVNESIWEHMKLIFYPMVLFALIQRRFTEWDSFWWVKLVGISVGLLLIPVIYYTYTGILGISADWFNITIFFLATMAAYRLESKLFRKGTKGPIPEWAALLLLAGIGALFTWMTFAPPQIPFFRDPVTGTYGFQG